jgi:predicted outer membrane repeat protein
MENIGSWSDLINCTFSRNFSSWGGGLANDNSQPKLTDCTFIGNVSSYKGGAMANYDASPPITNCTFIGNCAELGGAIYGADCSPKLTNCTFTGNLAEKGGVAYNNDSTIKLTNCTLSDNRAITGGVIYDDEGDSILINCKLAANTAVSGGVIYSGDESYAKLTNCILSGNTAVSGGVIYGFDDSFVRLTYCTLADNSADNGSALACDSYQQQNPSNIEVTNSILWDSGNEIWNNDGSIITIAYSDVQGGWPGDGNIDADPLFVEPGHLDADGVWLEGDYSLRAGSPCLDAGTDAEIYEDIEGNVRPSDFPGADNNGGLADFDMGAYETFAVPKGEVSIFPRTVNRSSRGQKVSAVLYMPEPIAGGKIDMSEPLVLYPGAVEASEQKLQDEQTESGVSVRAFFDRAEMLADMPDNGETEVTIVGRFITGEYFYCTDEIKVVSSQR